MSSLSDVLWDSDDSWHFFRYFSFALEEHVNVLLSFGKELFNLKLCVACESVKQLYKYADKRQ